MTTATPTARRSAPLDGVCAAVGFLTVLPVPEDRAARGHDHATSFFPWIGAALGVAAAAAARIPFDPLVSGALAVALLFAATGGLHWDGWADVLDATVTPGLDRERRVSILADPRTGAHAAFGVAILALVAAGTVSRAPSWGVVLGCALGRGVMVGTLRWAPALRRSGSAARLRAHARPAGAAVGVALIAAASVGGGAPVRAVVLALATGLAVAWLFAAFVVRRLGGLNGDGHGATGLLAETGVWIVTAGWSGAP